MTLQQWLDPWKNKSKDVQDRVNLALGFLQKHYGAAREDKIKCFSSILSHASNSWLAAALRA